MHTTIRVTAERLATVYTSDDLIELVKSLALRATGELYEITLAGTPRDCDWLYLESDFSHQWAPEELWRAYRTLECGLRPKPFTFELGRARDLEDVFTR